MLDFGTRLEVILPVALSELLPAEVLAVLARLGVDVVAMCLLLGLLALRRRGGRDLVTACAAFNAGLFAVAQVITSADIGVGAGFGLFAVLSIIRLRSELFSNTQLAYVFSTLSLALATGIPGVPVATGALLSALVVVTIAVVDAGRGRGAPTTATVTLDDVHRDRTVLIAELERRLGVEVVTVTVLEVDLVRETTVVTMVSRPGRDSAGQDRESLRMEQL